MGSGLVHAEFRANDENLTHAWYLQEVMVLSRYWELSGPPQHESIQITCLLSVTRYNTFPATLVNASIENSTPT